MTDIHPRPLSHHRPTMKARWRRLLRRVREAIDPRLWTQTQREGAWLVLVIAALLLTGKGAIE